MRQFYELFWPLILILWLSFGILSAGYTFGGYVDCRCPICKRARIAGSYRCASYAEAVFASVVLFMFGPIGLLANWFDSILIKLPMRWERPNYAKWQKIM